MEPCDFKARYQVRSFVVSLSRVLLFKVTVENFIRVLTGRLPPSTPRSKRLLSDDRSNILIYMTGEALFALFDSVWESNDIV